MKKFLTIIILSTFVFSYIALAQQTGDTPKMSVAFFDLAENDNTANLHGSMVRDQNGDPCALIRVQTTQNGFAWDFGQMQPVKVEQKTGEIWIYVPYGVKRMTVRHTRLGTMTYEFPIPVEKARTYVMDLAAANVVVLVEQEVTQQWVVFKLDPPTAYVELDGHLLDTKNGMAKKFVPFGKYKYTVKAKNYHPLNGDVEVRGDQGSLVVDVKLQPAFGYLAFVESPELEGAVVFLDDEQIGTIPLAEAPRVPSGNHRVMVSKAKFKPWYADIQVNDNGICSLAPSLTPNFLNVTVSSMEGAEIYANGLYLGTAPWVGDLEYDTYSFEVRKPSHRAVYRTLELFEGCSGEIVLPQPIPVYGSLNVDCDYIAKVTLDGEPVGETPCLVSKVLIGEHTLVVSAAGYGTATRNISVQEGEIEDVLIEIGQFVQGAQEKAVESEKTVAQEEKVKPEKKVEPKEKGKKTAPKDLPKFNKNIVKAGYGPLRLYGSGTKDVFHMHSLYVGYNHSFIRNHVGVAVGADFSYSFRNNYDEANYSDLAICVPVDFICRFGKFWINAGVCGIFHLPKAVSKKDNYSIDLGIPKNSRSELPVCLENAFPGFQVGVRYELAKRIAVGYNLTGNIVNLSHGQLDLVNYRLNFLSNMFYIGILF